MLDINFVITISKHNQKKVLWENSWIFKQAISSNSSRKCMEISLENLHVDTGLVKG